MTVLNTGGIRDIEFSLQALPGKRRYQDMNLSWQKNLSGRTFWQNIKATQEVNS